MKFWKECKLAKEGHWFETKSLNTYYNKYAIDFLGEFQKHGHKQDIDY